MATAQGLTVSLCGSSRAATATAAVARTTADMRAHRWLLALLVPPAIFVAMVALLAQHPDAAAFVLRVATVGVPTLAAVATKSLSRRGWPVIVAALLLTALLWSDE